MRRRQHRKLRYQSWMPMMMAIVLVFVFIAIGCVMPKDVVSGKVTDKWEEDGDFMLEIDNSFTKEVECFEYHNIRVGDVYEWGEESDEMNTICCVMVPVILFFAALAIITIGWDD